MKVLMVDDEADIRAVGRLANYYLASDAFAKSRRLVRAGLEWRAILLTAGRATTARSAA